MHSSPVRLAPLTSTPSEPGQGVNDDSTRIPGPSQDNLLAPSGTESVGLTFLDGVADRGNPCGVEDREESRKRLVEF